MNIELEQDVYDRVVKVIADALRIKPEKIKEDSTVFLDLGAESIDVLDIRFRLEKEFGIKIKDGEIIESLGDELSLDDINEIFTTRSTVEFIQKKLN